MKADINTTTIANILKMYVATTKKWQQNSLQERTQRH